MSEDNIKLLNLAVKPQEVPVNPSALHSLLLAMLGRLDTLEVETQWRDSSPGDRRLPTPTSSAAADGESRLLSRIQACEDGVSKVMELMEELHNQKDDLRDEIKDHQKKLAAVQEETLTVVEKCCHRVDALEETVTSLKDAFQKSPDPEQLSQCMTWDNMQSALLSKTENLQKELVNSGAAGPASAVGATHPPYSSNFTAANTSYTSTPSSPDPVEDAVRRASPTSPVVSGEISTVQSPQQTHLETHLTTARISLSRGSNGSERYLETMETLRNIGNLKENFDKLEARLAALEEEKVNQTELNHFRELIAGSQDVSNNVMDQLNQHRAFKDSLMSEWEKNNLLDMFKNPTSQDRETTSEGASESVDSDRGEFHELRQQIFYLSCVQKLEEDVKQLKAKQALSEKRMTDQHLQDQLDDLLCLTSELSSSLEDDERDERSSEGLDQNKDRSASCLQQQTGSRAGPLVIRQNVELVNDVQKAILQLQAECEKLHETTRCLHEDNRQKQSHIEELYKMTEELEEKKADKQMVESEIKADKSALESKVSRLQFDSATEQLNTMFHELLNKVTGQEQDWNKVIDKLSTEMECKLNRIELESMKKQLEDRWKSIHERLQAQSAPEHEDAAGIRKQLVDRFHCLSCDRPVVKHIPGPHVVTLPSSPGFPSRKSIRPFTVYALEQIRQHYRSKCIAELTDYSHLVVPRSCGGRHTVISASQRRASLQRMKHHSQPELNLSDEVSLVGLDGKIYKGRLNPAETRNADTKLPPISTKDDKPRVSTSHKPAVSPEVGYNALVHQPQSARSAQCSRSVSSISGRDWPVSALGCASQSSITQTSATGESNSEPLDNQ